MRKSDITADLVSRLVGSQFPQWAGLPVKPVDADGWDNATFRLGEEMSVRLPAESVVIEVRDNGPGIPDEELAYIFESFRSGSSRGGTGMGLAIVKAIVEAHGGAVSAENLPGGGASFRLRIPAQGPPPPAAIEQDEPRHREVAVRA